VPVRPQGPGDRQPNDPSPNNPDVHLYILPDRSAVLEDAAHAMGAAYSSRNIGQLRTATAFSFYCIPPRT
jgi:DegT/DnrJ/EryC1/StrS aminotransferase family